MINQQLLDFIRGQLKSGLTKEKITSELLANGWSPEDIEEGLRVLTIPTASVPEGARNNIATDYVSKKKIIFAKIKKFPGLFSILAGLMIFIVVFCLCKIFGVNGISFSLFPTYLAIGIPLGVTITIFLYSYLVSRKQKVNLPKTEAVISKPIPALTKTEKKTEEELVTPTQILDSLLAVAIDNRASDVHFEPEREGFAVRFRIDGILHPIETLNTNIQEQVISRIKVLSQMDIIEHRLPKDGHFEFPHKNTIYNIRVSTMPEIYGESIVFRIHGIHEVVHKIEELGLEPEQLVLFNALIKSPSGMILVTGPTGSGKTDLIYSILKDLSSEEKNIITIEDPVEYQLENIRQTSINEDLGLSFVIAMRSVLRQDPDVLMLGEIRDGETALLAIQASLSGILLFSTFHTFDLPALVNRLVEMNISRTIVAQSLRGVISVRLVRKICEVCKEPIVLTEEQKIILPPEMVNDTFYHGRGCDSCHNLGYSDRIGVFEIIEIDDEIRASLSDSEPSTNILALLKKKNIMSLRLAAFEKARKGITTVDEVLRVVGYLKD